MYDSREWRKFFHAKHFAWRDLVFPLFYFLVKWMFRFIVFVLVFC